MTGIIMNPISDDEVEHRRVAAIANAERVDQAVWLMREQIARLAGEDAQLRAAGQPGMTQRYMVMRALQGLKASGFTQQEIMEMLAR